MLLFQTTVKTSEGLKILGLGNITVIGHKIAWQILAVSCSLMFSESMNCFTEHWANIRVSSGSTAFPSVMCT